jgi:hypothetical protein
MSDKSEHVHEARIIIGVHHFINSFYVNYGDNQYVHAELKDDYVDIGGIRLQYDQQNRQLSFSSDRKITQRIKGTTLIVDIEDLEEELSQME